MKQPDPLSNVLRNDLLDHEREIIADEKFIGFAKGKDYIMVTLEILSLLSVLLTLNKYLQFY